MSNVPQAKAIIDKLLHSDETMTAFTRSSLNAARALLDREPPAGGFMVSRDDRSMTKEEVAEARRLRFEQRWGLKRIQIHLGHNSARVSEAINGKRDGI
jgi:hypothetical protein